MNDLQRLIMGLQIEQPMGGDSDHYSMRSHMTAPAGYGRSTSRAISASATTSTTSGAKSTADALTLEKMAAMLKAVSPLMPAGASGSPLFGMAWDDDFSLKPYGAGGKTALEALTEKDKSDWETDMRSTPAAFFDVEGHSKDRERREAQKVAAGITRQATENSIAAIRADFPHLAGGRLVAAGGGSNFERLVEILNVANFDRADYGYSNHRGYQAYLEGMARKWNFNDHLRLIEHAKLVDLPIGVPVVEKKAGVSDPCELPSELEAALLSEAERAYGSAARGGW
jgi:hypothetical protein